MAVRVFMSYSHKDEELRDQLEVHLTTLKRQGLVEVWNDRRLLAGDRLDWTIDKELNRADIILLLLSPDFIASDYCYKMEKGRALERHREGTARLISVILRPCEWKHTDLKEYVVTPKDGKPINLWTNIDEAFLDVVESIRRAIKEIEQANVPEQKHEPKPKPPPKPIENPSPKEMKTSSPRSSNMRIRKEFTKADKDSFLREAFEYISLFFQGSLKELKARNSDIETHYRQVDRNSFTTAIYRNGEKKVSCTICLGGMFRSAISYSSSDNAVPILCNETLTVGKDDQKLFLQSSDVMLYLPGGGNNAFSHEGGAERLWAKLIEPLQTEEW